MESIIVSKAETKQPTAISGNTKNDINYPA